MLRPRFLCLFSMTLALGAPCAPGQTPKGFLEGVSTRGEVSPSVGPGAHNARNTSEDCLVSLKRRGIKVRGDDTAGNGSGRYCRPGHGMSFARDEVPKCVSMTLGATICLSLGRGAGV
jgi:hypothetical protein